MDCRRDRISKARLGLRLTLRHYVWYEHFITSNLRVDVFQSSMLNRRRILLWLIWSTSTLVAAPIAFWVKVFLGDDTGEMSLRFALAGGLTYYIILTLVVSTVPYVAELYLDVQQRRGSWVEVACVAGTCVLVTFAVFSAVILGALATVTQGPRFQRLEYPGDVGKGFALSLPGIWALAFLLVTAWAFDRQAAN